MDFEDEALPESRMRARAPTARSCPAACDCAGPRYVASLRLSFCGLYRAGVMICSILDEVRYLTYSVLHALRWLTCASFNIVNMTEQALRAVNVEHGAPLEKTMKVAFKNDDALR